MINFVRFREDDYIAKIPTGWIICFRHVKQSPPEYFKELLHVNYVFIFDPFHLMNIN